MEALSVTVRRASEISGLGKTTIFQLLKEKRLTRRKVGRRTLIDVPELRKLIHESAVEG